MGDFRTLVESLVVGYGGKNVDLAKAIGITQDKFSKILAKETATPQICLKLAEVTGASPSKILRAAGHGAVADLIEDLYGMPARRSALRSGGVRLTPIEEQRARQWRLLQSSPELTKARKALEDLLATLIKLQAARSSHAPARSV